MQELLYDNNMAVTDLKNILLCYIMYNHFQSRAISMINDS